MELVTQLAALGFTEYEAKVYVALLQDYPATGYQISKGAGIPRSMVYEALGRLDARGAVQKTEEAKATLYRPVAPDVLLDRLSSAFEQHIDVLRPGLTRLFQAQDTGHLWTFTGEANVLAQAADLLRRAEHEAMLVLTDNSLGVLRAEIEAAAARGVGLGALLTGSERLDVGQVAYHPPRESQMHKLSDSLVIVVDEREVLIASGPPTFTATVTTNDNMVQISRQFVWMELFAQRIFARIGPDLLAKLDPADREVFEHSLHESPRDSNG